MHLNYFFICRISSFLDTEILGLRFSKAFSQNKDEIILLFASTSPTRSFYLKCLLSPAFTCLSFPIEFHRKKKNSIDLFSELTDLEVIKVIQYENERAFSIVLEKGYTLVFKLFGNRSNILVYKDKQHIDMFHKNIESDTRISTDLDRKMECTKEDFVEDPDLLKWFPTLRGIPERYMQSKGYVNLSSLEKWDLVLETLQILKGSSKFYLIKIKDKHHLSLLPLGEVVQEFNEVSKALNTFFQVFIRIDVFGKYKRKILSSIGAEIRRSENYIVKTQKKLDKLKNETNYQQIGDVLMANIHNQKFQGSIVKLHNFYTEKDIDIRVKPALSPQKNAESYYRKSKNQFKEIEALKDNIQSKENKLAELFHNEKMVAECKSHKDLDGLLKSFGLKNNTTDKQLIQPYFEKEIFGFRILVGKNAKSNDLLLNTYSHKEDLWLHVKDAAGSHVLVKYQSGKKYSKELIEEAARIAAFHSKRKTESLVPVAYTERKYVRKRKGDAPGLAVVDREKVVLVEPATNR